jgi:hypothetical protein
MRMPTSVCFVGQKFAQLDKGGCRKERLQPWLETQTP